MVILDIRNSRLKDFFDMWYLARNRSFDLLLLRGSIKATFERRRTPVLTETPFALTDRFLLDETKGQQWRGFLHRLQLEAGTPDLVAVGSRIVEFVGPILRDSIIRNRTWHSPEAAQNRSSDSSVGAPCVDLTGQQFSCSSDIQTRVHEPALLICSALLIFQRLYSSRSHLGMDHQILALDGKTLVLPIPASNTDSEEADRLVAR